MDREQLDKLKIGELRKLAPTIKTTKKDVLVEAILDDLSTPKDNKVVDVVGEEKVSKKPPNKLRIVLDDTELIEVMQRRNKIDKYFPSGIIVALKKQTGCECVIENYEYFMEVLESIDKVLQIEINKAYANITGSRAQYTTCSGCLSNRVKVLRAHYNNKIDG